MPKCESMYSCICCSGTAVSEPATAGEIAAGAFTSVAETAGADGAWETCAEGASVFITLSPIHPTTATAATGWSHSMPGLNQFCCTS